MTAASDSFNRTAETPLAAPWTSVIGGGANSDGSAAVSTASTDRRSLYSGTWGNDQYAQGTVGNLSGSARYAMVNVRLATTGGGRGYGAFTDGVSGAGHTGIERWDAGVQTVILDIATTFANGDVLKLDATGTTLTVYKNGASVGSVVDATYSGGNPGVGAFDLATVDDWSAADPAGGVSAVGRHRRKRLVRGRGLHSIDRFLVPPRRVVFVGVAPAITLQPTDQAGAVGGTATFNTTVTGATSFQWEHSDDGNTWANAAGSSTSEDYTTPTLTRAEAGDWYRLKATNSNGTTTSNRVLLTVTDIPTSYASSVGFVVGSNL